MFWIQELILQLRGGPKIWVNFFLWNQNIGAKCKICLLHINGWPDMEFYLIMMVSGVSGGNHWGGGHWSGGEGGLERVWASVCLSLSVCPVKIFEIVMNLPLPWIPQSVWPRYSPGRPPGRWVDTCPPFLQHYCMTVWQSDYNTIWLSNCLRRKNILHQALSKWATAPW